MKLEEVLPAMREGRIAIDRDGHHWSIHEGVAHIQDSEGFCYFNEPLRLDGWTLEPEPRVEWPKGSLQWAETEAKRLGLRYIRRRGLTLDSITIGCEWRRITAQERHALDWEVVP